MRCPRCLSSNIAPFAVVLWKCSDCNAVFSTPEPDAVVVAPDGVVEGGKYFQSAADATNTDSE